MKRYISTLILLWVLGGICLGLAASMAHGDPSAGAYPPPDPSTSCYAPGNADVYKIEDDGPDRAIVTYYNAVTKCSDNVDTTLTSPNGIAVQIIIEVGVDAEDRERVTVIPRSGQYMAFPPDAAVLDGEQVEIVVQGGLS